MLTTLEEVLWFVIVNEVVGCGYSSWRYRWTMQESRGVVTDEGLKASLAVD